MTTSMRLDQVATLVRTHRLPDGTALEPASIAMALGVEPGERQGTDAHGVTTQVRPRGLTLRAAGLERRIDADQTRGLYAYLSQAAVR